MKGYARMSGQPLAADAEVLYALIRRYGVDLYLRSYSNQTENIDKLIEELEKNRTRRPAGRFGTYFCF